MNTEQKIDSIYKMVNEQNIQLAKFMTHQEQHRKEIDTHYTEITKLVEVKNKLWGSVITVSSVISIAGIVIGFLIKK